MQAGDVAVVVAGGDAVTDAQKRGPSSGRISTSIMGMGVSPAFRLARRRR